MDKITESENLSKEGNFKSYSDSVDLNKKRNKTKRLVITSIVSFILGGVFLFLDNFLSYPPFFVTFLFFSFVVTPSLGIIASIFWLRGKSLSSQLLTMGVILVLSLIAIISARCVLVSFLLHIYTPPALNAVNIEVYNQCVEFAKNHNEDKTLTLGRGFRIMVNGEFYILSPGNAFERNRAEEVFSEEQITEIEELCDQLFAVRCVLFKRDNDMLFFYKWANTVLSLDPFELAYILPVSPGVLYSLNGNNPNEIDSSILNSKKPFTRICGNWYTSRKLMLSGLRSSTPASVPKSFIDHSVQIEAIDLEELHKFD